MKLILFLACTLFAGVLSAQQLYELRIYHCNEGKLDALQARFRDHTTKLFKKHGMNNIGYWTPDEPNNQDLYYILSYPSREARDASWKAFGADPDWKEAAKASELNGKIVKSVESSFMKLNEDLTKTIKLKQKSPERLFEMRTYYCNPDKYPTLVKRFKDHTRKLFKKHDMENIMYFETIEKDGAQPKLLYFIAHKDANSAKASWDAFRVDPKWIKVRDASEVNGKIIEKIQSVYLKPTDYSKFK